MLLPKRAHIKEPRANTVIQVSNSGSMSNSTAIDPVVLGAVISAGVISACLIGACLIKVSLSLDPYEEQGVASGQKRRLPGRFREWASERGSSLRGRLSTISTYSGKFYGGQGPEDDFMTGYMREKRHDKNTKSSEKSNEVAEAIGKDS